MLALRYARQSRCLFFSPLLYSTTTPTTSTSSIASSATSNLGPLSFFPSISFPSSSPSNPDEAPQTKDILLPFKNWFSTRKNPLYEQIFEILGTLEGLSAFEALRSLNIRLTERVVIDVLKYGKSQKDVFSCVRFFDWAGNHGGFFHTAATFHAMFRIFVHANSSWVIHDFLDKYSKTNAANHTVRFYDTLVIGYSVVGKPEIALQVFGKMRFQGIDLNSFAYHVLLNSLVDAGFFDVVLMLVEQIQIRGLENEVTHSIMMKNFCKKKDLLQAEVYLRCLISGSCENVDRKVGFGDALVGTLVDALCRDKQFEKADALVEEMKKEGVVSDKYAYGLWVRNLIQAGKLDGALEFYKCKMKKDGHAPALHQYNSLVCRLMRENRLKEVFDLLLEMKEQKILPDEVTMNATLCFFCKAGMMDAAVELYESRAEFGLSVNSISYNCLMNSLFVETSIDDAYSVLKSAIGHGYFPGKRTFSIIIDALCRERKLDEVKELILAALDRNFTPNHVVYGDFIQALCKSGRVEDGYKVLGEVHRFNANTTRNTYFTLINGFNQTGRGDLSAKLLIEMQEKGHKPTRKLFRTVLCCLSSIDSEESQRQFFKLLELQLSRHKSGSQTYNFFIEGAGHAKKPHLARQVYEMMVKSGISPNLQSDKLLLQSFLKSGKINDAFNFFHDLFERREITRKFWHIMIVGLCKVDKLEHALVVFWKMRKNNNINPSIECYEELVKLLCTYKDYSRAFEIIDDLEKLGRPISSFIGNVLLLHTLYSRELYYVWCKLTMTNLNNLTPGKVMLRELIEAFSGSIKGDQDVEDLEVLIHRCFPLDIYTYNMLLRKIIMTDINYACEYFCQFYEKGYEPNRWSYDILIHGLLKHRRSAEAKLVAEEMFRKGLHLTEATESLL